MLQNTAEALIEHHTADPKGEYSARDHAGNQADFRPKGHVNDHAQNAAAYHREDKAHHDVKPAKGKRAFSRFSFTHTVKRKAQHQSSQNGNDAWIPYKLSGTIEAFVQREGRRNRQKHFTEALLHHGVQIAPRKVIPQVCHSLHANNQHSACQQRCPVSAGEDTCEHTHGKTIQINQQQQAELSQ